MKIGRGTRRVVVSVVCCALGSAGAIAAVSPAASAPAATPSVSSQIVVLQDGASVAALTSQLNISPTNVYGFALTGFSAPLTATQIAALRSNPSVVSVTADRTFHSEGVSATPAKASGNDVPQIVSREAKRIGILNSPTAHVNGKGKGINADIAIVDSGIDPHHPDLNVVGGYNCTTSHRNQWADDNGHGTMVAGIAAARDNDIDIVGVAPGARLWAIKVLDASGNATDAAFLCGLDWLVAHADSIDVANMSLAGAPDGFPPGTRFDDTNCGRSDNDIQHTAICRAVKRGVVIVAGAGNDHIDSALSTPAAYPEVITVSGIVDSDGQPGGLGGPDLCTQSPDDTFASFSNYGAPVDVAAPAVCVSSTYPEPGAVATDSGTSFATPFVTGAAALLRSQHHRLSPADVETIIKATASPGPITGDPDQFHEGVLNVAGY